MIKRSFSTLALLTFTLILMLFGYWWFVDPINEPLTVTASRTDKSVYLPGETMWVTRHVCRGTMASYLTHRAFVDHIFYTLADFQSAAPSVGCYDARVGIVIPALPAGRYTYRVWVDIRLNPIKVITLVLPDLQVIVAEATNISGDETILVHGL